MNRISKKVVTVIIISISLILTGCGPNKKNQNGAPSMTKSATSRPTTSVSSNSATGTDSTRETNKSSVAVSDGLFLPPLAFPLPKVPAGPATKTYGEKYVNSAFAFAVAFHYRVNNFPELWEPNLKKDPNFIPILKLKLETVSSFFSGELQKIYIDAIPDLVNPNLIAPVYDPKTDVIHYAEKTVWQTWSAMITGIPKRLKDGTLPGPNTHNWGGLTAVAPWDMGVSVGVPVTMVDTLPGYGPTLLVRFKIIINEIYQDNTKGIFKTPVTQDMSYWIIPNPDEIASKDYPWVIVQWISHGSSFGKLFIVKPIDASKK